MKPLHYFLITVLAIGSSLALAKPRPNIVMIMIDDMGFSDIGCYGGEIQTPNIDKLADGGIKFSQFDNCGKCEPSRAALVTGYNWFSYQSGMNNLNEVERALLPAFGGPCPSARKAIQHS